MQFTTEDSKVINCIICGEKTTSVLSHNAQPVRNGRCCDVCNSCIVVPTRLTLAMSKNVKEGGRLKLTKGIKDGK